MKLKILFFLYILSLFSCKKEEDKIDKVQISPIVYPEGIADYLYQFKEYRYDSSIDTLDTLRYDSIYNQLYVYSTNYGETNIIESNYIFNNTGSIPIAFDYKFIGYSGLISLSIRSEDNKDYLYHIFEDTLGNYNTVLRISKENLSYYKIVFYIRSSQDLTIFVNNLR